MVEKKMRRDERDAKGVSKTFNEMCLSATGSDVIGEY